MFLIEINGMARYHKCIPTVETKYVDTIAGESAVIMSRLEDDGYEGMVRFAEHPEDTLISVCIGSRETCVQLIRHYPWQKDTLTSNVPVYRASKTGWFEGFIKAIVRGTTITIYDNGWCWNVNYKGI